MSAKEPSAGEMLRGITVIECGDELGARYCGRLFSVLGAKVIRVTAAATAPQPFDRWLDEGKSSAPSLDAALATTNHHADVILAGQTPDRVHATDDALSKHNLDTLRSGLTWFGMTGPYASWRGDDALIHALSGLAFGFGPPEGPPTLPQGRAPQIIGGATLYLATLAALWSRKCQNAPRSVDVSILESALCLVDVGVAALYQTPGVAIRLGVNRFAPNHPFATYRSADGWIGITALTPAQWTAFCTLISKPEWATDPRFASSPLRVLHADIIDAALFDILPTRTSEAWLTDGQKLRIPLAPVPRPSELFETEHWRQRGSFTPLPGEANAKAPGLPFRAAFDGHKSGPPKAKGHAPLAGVRVIDFTMGWAGPLATRHLGDLGADVIKIESFSHIDWWRGWEPQIQSDPPIHECMPNFNAMNRNKRGIALDLTTQDGIARAKQLVAGADIVVENYAPGVMEKLGLGPQTLLTLRPGLVMVSMGAFGAIGPWSHFRAYGSTVEHASGFPQINGHADWPPAMQHVAYGDPIAGIYGAIAALTGLAAREKLGGAWLDLSQVECLFQLNAEAIIGSQFEGDPPRLGSRSLHTAPRCVIPARDAALAVSVTDRAAWLGLCEVLSRSDWARDPSLNTAQGRNARADEIETALATWAEEREATEAAAILQQNGVAAAPVNPSHNLLTDPHLLATDVWVLLERRYVGLHMMASAPYLMEGKRLKVSRPAPVVGEHTEEVLTLIA